jgi:hypothetical protein
MYDELSDEIILKFFTYISARRLRHKKAFVFHVYFRPSSDDITEGYKLSSIQKRKFSLHLSDFFGIWTVLLPTNVSKAMLFEIITFVFYFFLFFFPITYRVVNNIIPGG